jgi:hypothetical protein
MFIACGRNWPMTMTGANRLLAASDRLLPALGQRQDQFALIVLFVD